MKDPDDELCECSVRCCAYFNETMQGNEVYAFLSNPLEKTHAIISII